ncbi:MAG TPA: HipA family kinase [Candidatus Angelobacter sp.]|nr:HipA family kinase [Candidatus Angelobacter sp.]
MRASNSEYYVVKFRNNPQDVRILANEYLGTKLGIMLGLPMPKVAIIDVPESLIAQSPELTIENGALTVPCASGLQFGSRYVVDPHQASVFDYLPETMLHKVGNREDLHRMVVFDKWTGNSDGRQAVFVKPARARTYRAVFIDQGYCFNAGEWNFPDSPLRGVYARNSVYEAVTGWDSFEPILSRVEQIDIAGIWTIAREIPGEWYRNDTDALTRLVESLYERRVLVRELITSFRASSRSPFPNWKDD